MSLINDALKKARDEEAASAAPDKVKVRARDVVPSQGKLVALALVMGGIIIILLSVIIVAIVQFFRKPEPVVIKEASPIQVVVEPSVAVKPAESEAVDMPESSVPALDSTPEAAPVQLPPEETKLSEASSGGEPVVTEVAPAAMQAAPEASAPKPEGPDPKIAEFVQSIQVRGIGRTKVLLLIPGHEEATAYAEGDAIDCAFELTLVSIGPHKLQLEDSNGQKYGKPL